MDSSRFWFATLAIAGAGLSSCSATGDTRPAPDKLESVTWQLMAYGDPASPTLPPEGVAVTARFSAEEGSVSGKSGCNNYRAAYGTDGEMLTVGPAMSTAMMCEPAQMEVEREFTDTLQSAEEYFIQDGILEITSREGRILTFNVLPPLSLEGTLWFADRYNNGNEAVVSVVRGTEPSAAFGDGSVSGSAGCNTFNGGYEVDGEGLSIGPFSMTEVFCREPVGTMEQESQYLAALEMAEVYTIEGDRLELRTAEGALAASFTADPAALDNGEVGAP